MCVHTTCVAPVHPLINLVLNYRRMHCYVKSTAHPFESITSPSLPHSLPTSLPHSLPTSLPHSLPTSLPPYLTPSLPTSLPPYLTHSLTPSLPHSLPTSLPPSLPHSLPTSLTPSLPPSVVRADKNIYRIVGFEVEPQSIHSSAITKQPDDRCSINKDDLKVMELKNSS